jgi:hypothetical protein
LALHASLAGLKESTLPLQGSANRAKQTATFKATAELKKADKANKAAANKLMVAEAAAVKASAHAEALKQARALKAGKLTTALASAPASPFSTPSSRVELLRACVDAYRSAPARQLVSEANERLLGSIRTELAPKSCAFLR